MSHSCFESVLLSLHRLSILILLINALYTFFFKYKSWCIDQKIVFMQLNILTISVYSFSEPFNDATIQDCEVDLIKLQQKRLGCCLSVYDGESLYFMYPK